MKFKVGDKVKVVKNVHEHKIGQKKTIVAFANGLDYELDCGGFINKENIKLAETKNNRIENLEKEVEELKLIVAKLREPSNLVKEELVKSNNELRAEVIGKAKKFVKEKLSQVDLRVKDSRPGYGCWIVNNFDFVINENKKTVVVLCKGVNLNVLEKFKSKCMPSDVFNEHIGKAIALGRALNLDVSEFENCVQPDIAVGQITSILTYSGTETGEVCEVTSINNKGLPKYIDGMKATRYKILNDTNAIYEVN